MNRYRKHCQPGIPYLVFVFFILVFSCSAPRLPTYPLRDAGSYDHVLNADGLNIIVDPLFDASQHKTYFGADLLKENILPVFVLVKNLDAKGSCVVFSNKISLRGLVISFMGENDELEAADSSVGKDLAAIGGVLVSMPLMLAGLSLISDSAEIKRNFKAKEFQTQTLSVGEQGSGFVYFRLPEKKSDIPENLAIGIEIMNLQDKHSQMFYIPIAWKGENL